MRVGARNLVRGLAALALVLLGLGVGGGTPAFAHASLVGSTPEQGAVLDALPGEVVFEFSDDMDATAYVVVTGPDGASATVGDPEVRGTEVRQRLAPGTAALEGTYVMAVKAVSVDGHPVTGRVEFAVGRPSDAGSPEPSESSSPASEPVSAAGRNGSSAAPGAEIGGRPLWVWLVGPGCLLAALGLWWTGRRVSS